jgi:lactoylglutathione lyase
MLRITDPEKSVKYYTENFGMTLVDKFDFPQYSFSLYFLTTIPDGEKYNLTPGTQEAHDFLWSMDGVALELTHNYNPQHKYHPGNEERDGFGHIAFNVEDVYDATDRLLQAGVQFKKKPDEGRMKGLAFAYDPGKGFSSRCMTSWDPFRFPNFYPKLFLPSSQLLYKYSK